MYESTKQKNVKPPQIYQGNYKLTNSRNIYPPANTTRLSTLLTTTYTPKVNRTKQKLIIESPEQNKRKKIMSIIRSITLDEDDRKEKNHRKAKSKLSYIPQQKPLIQGKFTSTEQELLAKFKQKKKIIESQVPQILTKKAMNNLLIRDSRHVSDPVEYISISKYIHKVSEEYYQHKKNSIIERIKRDDLRFHKLKYKIPFSEMYGSDYKRKGYLTYSTYENEYATLKQMHNEKSLQVAKEQSKILANLILDMQKGEDPNEIKKMNYLSTEPTIMKDNLLNAIFLKKILRKKNLSTDEEIGLNDPKKLKQQLRENEYKASKVMRKVEYPRFIKESFSLQTQTKYRGLNGKYFGVVC